MAPAVEFSLGEDDIYDFDILLALAVYLKSNFYLWYMLMFFNSDDFFELFLIENPKIPIPADENILKNISIIAKNIQMDENKFIKKINKLPEGDPKSQLQKLIINHNNNSNSQLQKIEEEIIKYYGLDDSDMKHIIYSLDSLGYYTYDFNKEVIEKMFSC